MKKENNWLERIFGLILFIFAIIWAYNDGNIWLVYILLFIFAIAFLYEIFG